jgi:hypothetical protein
LDLPPGSPLRLRLFLDGSCLEVFTGSGQALTTRVYRGKPLEGAHAEEAAGLELWAVGGEARLDDLHAYEVASAWAREAERPREPERG